MSNLQRGSRRENRALPLSPQPDIIAVRELTRGDTLYRSGDDSQALYRVENGLLKLFIDIPNGRERIIGLAGPGDLIGNVAPHHPVHGESVEALSSSVQVSVLDDSPAPLLQDMLLDAGGRQMQQLRETLEDSELPVPARLARTLARLASRFGQVQADGQVRLTLPLTHDNLAAMIGAARETTSFTLADMRSRGVLSGTRGNYSFNLHTLTDFASSTVQNSQH